MGSVFNVVNLSVINNTVDGSDVERRFGFFRGTWLLRKVCRGLPLLQWRRPLVRIPLLVDLLPSALKSSERESKH
ncbi:hypothetical protein T4B_1761 [Trichinella pseudospiralis]|uniref:Uncharacterized protein n=1 Tax=Trichinella pseudospiralis TaxID=6337 RepID=A0A0V1GN98_TRIPS|nr:hypothetical protein T4B_1761 [Trichinella pseudospiralis]